MVLIPVVNETTQIGITFFTLEQANLTGHSCHMVRQITIGWKIFFTPLAHTLLFVVFLNRLFFIHLKYAIEVEGTLEPVAQFIL